MNGTFEELLAGLGAEMQALRKENEYLRKELAQCPGVMPARPSVPVSNDGAGNYLHEILDNLTDAVIGVGLDGEILFINEQFSIFIGGRQSDLGGRVYDPRYGIITEDGFNQRVAHLRQNGGRLVYKASRAGGNGRDPHIFQVTAFIMDYYGRDTVWFFLQEISELVNSRNELRELNYLLDAILDNLPVYLFVKDVDDDFRYLYWNKAFADYSGIPSSKVIGRTDFEVFPDYNDAVKFRDDDLAVVGSGEPINRHETYVAADGNSRIVQTLKTLVQREGRGPLLIGVSMDITSMSNIEQELVQEKLKAEASDRLKSSFLANMSHEIRTPLNAIVGFSNLLVNTEDPADRQQFSDIIMQNSDILLPLINDILDLSKIEAGTLEYTRAPMDLLELCHNIYEVHRNKVRSGVELIFDNSDDAAGVIINEDANRICQVLNNLLGNAIKFTASGSIRFGYMANSNLIEMYVKDTGKGIPADKLDKIFERFVKLDKFAPGTGLGLAISRMIVHTIGGEMTVESEEGRGSIFRFTIPYRPQTAQMAPPPATPAPASGPAEPAVAAPVSQNRTILIAEDVRSNYLLVSALVRNRFRLVWAKDGKEAVDMFKECSPDLILMDVKMPGLNGLDATRIIRGYSATVPIVGMSANAFESDVQKARDVGMNDYLAKPVKKADFENMLKKYL